MSADQPIPSNKTPVSLRELAARARKWSAEVTSEANRRALTELANNLEAEAAELERGR
jgi:hypothetical protein